MSTQVSMELRTAKDLAKRSIPGILIYPIFWPFLAYGSNFVEKYEALTFIITVFMVVFSILRFYHVQVLNQVKQQEVKRWYRGLYLWTLPQVACWGGMFAYAMMIDDPYFLLFMAFSSAGIVAGGVNSFAPVRRLSLWYLGLFFGPPIIVGFFFSEHWVIGVLCLTYIVYMAGLSRNQHREYWLSINNEQVLARQSRTDALTQLDNRRFFDEKLNELVHLSSRNHEQLAVLVIDCDHFKSINDQYGHDVGDLVLQKVAQVIKQSLPRTTDVCARYGGEEFSALLAGTDLPGAQLVAERIRKNVEDCTIKLEEGEVKVTVSIGITAHEIQRFQQDLPRQLFREADQALYQAKQSGRNQCASYVAEDIPLT